MANARGTILVIDDEEVMREVLEALLAREGYDVHLAVNGMEGLELARTHSFDAAVVDVMMPGMDGLTVLDELKAMDEDLPVVMVTAFQSVETALTAMKRGAFDYITKPFKNDEVAGVLRNAVERTRLSRENRILKQNLQTHGSKFANIIGRSSKMRPGVRPGDPGRAEPLHRARERRERHRQGAGRAGAAQQLAARREGRSSPSTPATCRRTCSRASCSAT